MSFRDDLLRSIETGFIDYTIESERSFRPELLINDELRNKKVLSTILNELDSCDEFWFSVAFITNSGVSTIINTLIELEKRGVKGKILASQYLNFTQPIALERIRKFSNIELRIATDGEFHSKSYLFRKDNFYNIIIGSSNLTQTALCTNKELNIKVLATDKSELKQKLAEEFAREFDIAQTVTDNFLADYRKIYEYSRSARKVLVTNELKNSTKKISPNKMQLEALDNLQKLRIGGKNKALLISATGTGKTYLSAFDVLKFKPKKFLFLVHRKNIALKAKESFESIFSSDISMGLFSGSTKDLNSDYIFSTVQTISKDENLQLFDQKHFDYIVIDESHRAGASSYQKILDYFNPKFLLGMTATPERTDGFDIFKLFDYNIAYEIRLHNALSAKMLAPFHYYGVTDISIDGIEVDDKSDFNLLCAEERIERIIEKIKLYDCDNGNTRGLIFCSRIDECIALSNGFNQRGYRTISLAGSSSEEERIEAINRIESDDYSLKLDYIFSVDIFNEGIDIPKLNQIVMLRPTQSAIIFVQQLGRGLRKVQDKEYLTVIDFIGNYANNYMVPIALFGDTSYNKDTLRKLMFNGSNLIPGSSTVNFDQISKERIFNAINQAKLHNRRDLIVEYKLLKYKIGKIPMMMDFMNFGSRDPYLFVNNSNSYFNFVSSVEPELKNEISSKQIKYLEFFSKEINNAKRIEESILLKRLIKEKRISIGDFKKDFTNDFNYEISDRVIQSVNDNLNFLFVKENFEKKLIPIGEKYSLRVLDVINDEFLLSSGFENELKNITFYKFLMDSIDYSIHKYLINFSLNNFQDGFVLYRKYSRKDVFRILNWESNPVALNVGGYMISPDNSNCPVFVNYHKDEDISSSTKYLDKFISPQRFQWMSKNKRYLTSNDVRTILYEPIRLPLFIKKNNDEGDEFYYMGNLEPIVESAHETTISNDDSKQIPVVLMEFKMKTTVADEIFNYLIDKASN